MPSDKSPEHSDSESDPIGGGSTQEFVTEEGVHRLMHEYADKILNDKLKEMRDEISQAVEDTLDDRHGDLVSTLVDNTIDLLAPCSIRGNSEIANIYVFRGIRISADTTGDSNERTLLAHARAQPAHVCNERIGNGQRTNGSLRVTHKVLSHSGTLRAVFTL